MKPKWLDAQTEHQNTSLHSIPSCLVLSDLKSDKYYKLVAVDIPVDFPAKAKLKVFKGTSIISEQFDE